MDSYTGVIRKCEDCIFSLKKKVAPGEVDLFCYNPEVGHGNLWTPCYEARHYMYGRCLPEGLHFIEKEEENDDENT